ncbi:class I SAM-dependent methyltransferase [Pseudenhygromyxa sp. WMMC2535]|uniref:class I SAM-dependent methyltransferase n=1 Tax=Pseudenhygromyxa sp. WMMC2535 TaxID=2712867 RepID=UPI0015539C5A|nr:class I SAM-dependent methyltransferase [Pseudenhygromyxa sp. WMMC2535]NVB38800.1 class I SAM-dependent methyltransferase [Pseudenhygromyxa sp. WMMC2535]
MAASRNSKVKLRGQAARADRHELYELSVQDPKSEVQFVAKTFKRLRKRKASSLREDFCGTAVFSLAWVRSNRERTAIGVDLDGETLQWGLEQRVRPAGERDGVDYESRMTLREANVLDASPTLTDVAVGYNFSYWCFETREQLLAYFEAARAGLVDDGVLFLDAYGGTEVPMSEINEREVIDERGVVNEGEPFTYVWDQIRYNPITGHMDCAIHFEFEDGSRIDEAFSYSWRVWTLPELRELLLEAGFATVRIWAEREDDDGDGTGTYYETKDLDNEGVWWVYISAEN